MTYATILRSHSDQPAPTMFFFQLFTTQVKLLTTLRKKALENNLEKGEHAGN